MKTIATVLVLLACGPLLSAQTKPAVQLPPSVRLYEPKNLTPDRAANVALFVQNLVGVRVSWDNVPHAFVIRGTAQEQDMAEALVKRYDVPEAKVELTVYLVRASLAPAAPGREPQGGPVPAELKSAIDEMKGAFSYAHYTLWDAVVLQPKGNGGDMQGILPTADPKPYVYAIDCRLSGAVQSEAKTVNLGTFRFVLKMPTGDLESHISTSDLTVREGQKLVLGKIRLLARENADLFLVLTAKIY